MKENLSKLYREAELSLLIIYLGRNNWCAWKERRKHYLEDMNEAACTVRCRGLRTGGAGAYNAPPMEFDGEFQVC